MVTLELEKLTGLMGWRPFYTEDRFTKQDDEHVEALTGAVEILKAFAISDKEPDDDPWGLGALKPGSQALFKEAQRRHATGEPLPPWLQYGELDTYFSRDWSKPGKVPRRRREKVKRPPSTTRGARMLLPVDPETGKPLDPDHIDPPHPVYRNLPNYDGLVAKLALVD